MKKKLPLKAASILSLFIIIILAACKQDNTDSKAHITVVTNVTANGLEAPVADATVIISIDNTTSTSSTGVRDPSYPKTGYTGSNGQVDFSFPNGIVVNIYAYKVIGPLDTIKNKTFVAINPGETADKKVVLKR